MHVTATDEQFTRHGRDVYGLRSPRNPDTYDVDDGAPFEQRRQRRPGPELDDELDAGYEGQPVGDGVDRRAVGRRIRYEGHYRIGKEPRREVVRHLPVSVVVYSQIITKLELVNNVLN